MKLTKEELKRPDQIWVASKSMLNWMTGQATALIIAIVILFAATIGGVYYYQSKIHNEGKASQHYGLAKSYFEQWKIQSGAEKKADKVQEKSKEDLKKTEADLQSELALLAKDFPNSKANQMANLIRGQMAASSGKWTEAILFYESYLKALSGDDRVLGLYPLAQAYEQAGNLDKALSAHNDILKVKDSPYQEWSLLAKGRILRAQNKNDEAKKVYETFLDKFPRSSEVATVRGLMAP